jgi:transcription initiation factor IIE alpha subunit
VKGQDDLTSDEFLKLLQNFDQKDSEEASPTFEDSPSKLDWSDAKLNEPRQLTLKNVRDIFFALINQSRAQKRICKTEDNVTKLYAKCQALTDTTERLDKKIDKTRADLDAQHKIFHNEFSNL